MKKPFKTKAKDAAGHRVWAQQTFLGYKTSCRTEGCKIVPYEVLRGEIKGAL